MLDFDGGAAMDDIEVLEAEMTMPDTTADAIKALRSLPLTGPVGLAGSFTDGGDLQGLAVTINPESGDVLWLSLEQLSDEAVAAAVNETIGNAAHRSLRARHQGNDAFPL